MKCQFTLALVLLAVHSCHANKAAVFTPARCSTLTCTEPLVNKDDGTGQANLLCETTACAASDETTCCEAAATETPATAAAGGTPGPTPAPASAEPTPRAAAAAMAKVVTLLQDMNTKLSNSGKADAKSYNTYACWCETTLETTAAEITQAKDDVEGYQSAILSGKGLAAAGAVKITNMKQDLADNSAAQRDATEVRNKEGPAYIALKESSEKAIAYLEETMAILEKAGKGTTKFLQSLETVKVMSVVAGISPLLEMAPAKRMKGSDREVMQSFVTQPEDFFKLHASSALQTQQNPYGDFAPKSNRIQGILKNMYDGFVGDLESADAREADAQKSFEELLALKKKEYEDMDGLLEGEEKGFADNTRNAATAKRERDETQKRLKSTEEIYSQNQKQCKTKANQWAERIRLRTQEMQAIHSAVSSLQTPKAAPTVTPMFLQVSAAVAKPHVRAEVYRRLKVLATRHQDLQLAQIAVSARTTGHFDDIISKIDQMMASCRAEEAMDVAHRDRCEGKTKANTNAMADATHNSQREGAEMSRLDSAMIAKRSKITELRSEMNSTLQEIIDLGTFRNTEAGAYAEAQRDGKESIELLNKASASLSAFYRDTSLLQRQPEAEGENNKDEEPEAATPTKPPAPHTSINGEDYKASTGEARGVLALLGMISEDCEKELVAGTKNELAAQAAFKVAKAELNRVWEELERSRAVATVDLSTMGTDHQDAEQNRDAADADLEDEQNLESAITTDCQWVGTHFAPRSEARKAEMDELVGAKEFLAGVGTDDDLSFPEEEAAAAASGTSGAPGGVPADDYTANR